MDRLITVFRDISYEAIPIYPIKVTLIGDFGVPRAGKTLDFKNHDFEKIITEFPPSLPLKKNAKFYDNMAYAGTLMDIFQIKTCSLNCNNSRVE